MATNERTLQATSEQVWEVLSDGWLYPLWVVGASRMRDVEEHWPALGAQLHHSVGTWPVLADDVTEVVDCVPGSCLTLHAKARPTGTASVTIRLEPIPDGTRVTMEEEVVAGPGRLVPGPLRDVLLRWRNVESLRRLAFIAERRAAGAGPASDAGPES